MKVAVVGAGFAGMAAAISLQDAGHEVVLLERRGVLGGRATSYRDALSGEEVDNGTHLMVGAYTATLELAAAPGPRTSSNCNRSCVSTSSTTPACGRLSVRPCLRPSTCWPAFSRSTSVGAPAATPRASRGPRASASRPWA